MVPLYETPALPVSPQYASHTAGQGVSAAAIGWRDYFADPQLQALLAQALENNRDLRTAVLQIEQARAVYGIQRADLLPSIGAQAGVSRSRVPG